jgi:hypothetical protein
MASSTAGGQCVAGVMWPCPGVLPMAWSRARRGFDCELPLIVLAVDGGCVEQSWTGTFNASVLGPGWLLLLPSLPVERRLFPLLLSPMPLCLRVYVCLWCVCVPACGQAVSRRTTTRTCRRSSQVRTTATATTPSPRPEVSCAVWAASENCLNLNVWTPLNANATSKLPVGVFFHGGSFAGETRV